MPPTYVRLPLSVQDDEELGPREIALFLAIARHADAEGFAFPSLETIMKLTRLGKNSVCSGLGILDRRGHISTERRMKGNRREVNRYRIPAFSSEGLLSERLKSGRELINIKKNINTTDASASFVSEDRIEEKASSDSAPETAKVPKVPKVPQARVPKPKREKTPPLPMTAEILRLFSEPAEAAGVPLVFGREGAAAKKLATLYEGRDGELRDLCDFFLGALREGKEWWADKKPPLPSSLLPIIAHVVMAFGPRKPPETVPCPACGSLLAEPPVFCGACGLRNFADESAIGDAKARWRREHTREAVSA